MKVHLRVSTLITTSLIVGTLWGCGSETDSSQLAREVELEKLRNEGTIIEKVTIEQYQVRLEVGDTHQLTATGIDSNGDSRDVTNELTWQTSDETVATITNSGLLTAKSYAETPQGLITLTATTINGISDEKQISISDNKVSSINLKQISPESGPIHTCAPAKVSADVTYEDGYISLNSIKNIVFSVDQNSTAIINDQGEIYTSSPTLENTTITGKIDNTTGELEVTADPSSLNAISILVDENETDEVILNIGDRISLNALANYDSDVMNQAVNIDNAINWSITDTNFIGFSEKNIDDDSSDASLLALNSGTTHLLGSCGTKQKITSIVIEGDSQLDSIDVNDGQTDFTISPLQSINLTLTANYDGEPSILNVTEFAKWDTNGSGLITTKLINPGTDQATLRVTSNSTALGSALITVTFNSEVKNILINIE